jgi:hypothetical protein
VVSAELIAAAAGPSVGQATPAPAGEAEPPARPTGLKIKARNEDTRAAYVSVAVENECKAVRETPPGGRNTRFNQACFSVGQLVGSGLLHREYAEAKLGQAAKGCGLGEEEIERTLRSGIKAGMNKPRTIPERDTRPGAGPAPSAGPQEPAGQVIVRASELTPRKVSWLWPGRIPRGKLTTFAGVGGLGKTFVLLDVTARVTRGDEWPDSGGECCEPGEVLFVSGEDDAEDTLVPRLIELGANLDLVTFLSTDVLDKFTLRDISTLDAAAGQMQCLRLVAIDPPTAYLDGTDDHKNAELRQLLTPLKNWAAKHDVAIIFNTHVNKGGNGRADAMARVMGSVAWVNAVRAAHLFAEDPEDPARRLFLPLKSNLAKPRRGLAYRIAGRTDELDGPAAVEWLGEVDTTANQAVNRNDKPARAVKATEFLIERFRQKREWLSEELFVAAAAELDFFSDS